MSLGYGAWLRNSWKSAHLASLISPSCRWNSASRDARSKHMKNKSLFPHGAAWQWRKLSTFSNFPRTPVSSSSSRSTPSSMSSRALSSPVGIFQMLPKEAGPTASCTSKTFPSSFTHRAPTPTWCDGFGGKGLGVSGSHMVIMQCDGSAWWNTNPRSAATPSKRDFSNGTSSHTPRIPAARHPASDSPKMCANSSGSAGNPVGSRTMPP
mmetsp:Transcript_90392/g.260436  ORF Transcript_90392/g.260436 Transcript_90392/m.260436 type:complete len:209 (-) Transcript_90392:165-791(-)